MHYGVVVQYIGYILVYVYLLTYKLLEVPWSTQQSMFLLQEMGRRFGYTLLKLMRPQEFEFEGRRPYAELDPHFVTELVYMRL